MSDVMCSMGCASRGLEARARGATSRGSQPAGALRCRERPWLGPCSPPRPAQLAYPGDVYGVLYPTIKATRQSFSRERLRGKVMELLRGLMPGPWVTTALRLTNHVVGNLKRHGYLSRRLRKSSTIYLSDLRPTSFQPVNLRSTQRSHAASGARPHHAESGDAPAHRLRAATPGAAACACSAL